jgi:hypothetical protein
MMSPALRNGFLGAGDDITRSWKCSHVKKSQLLLMISGSGGPLSARRLGPLYESALRNEPKPYATVCYSDATAYKSWADA